MPGTLQTLLHGLGSVYEGKLRAGDNYNGGEIHVAVGLAEMLSKL